jgi:hypothetical protein|tara:strand:- start:278 stop:1126 length:849 start_codon:yes stop_codon:yes gene_type:complete
MKSVLLLLLVLISSCTVTKRVHRNGFHVEWHKNYLNNHSKGPKDEVKFGFDESTVSDGAIDNSIVPLPEEINETSEAISIETIDIPDTPILDALPTDKDGVSINQPTAHRIEESSESHFVTNNKLHKTRGYSKLGYYEKALLLNLIFYLILLGITLIIVMYFTGVWLFISESVIVAYCLLWVGLMFINAYFIFDLLDNGFGRLGFQILYEFIKWTLYILYGCLMLLLLALAIYGLYYFVLLLIALVQLIILYWEIIVTIIAVIAITVLVVLLLQWLGRIGII